MDAASVIIRRATVDDLPQLVELWQQEDHPWQELEKRFTEFQVADDGSGVILGALGIHIIKNQGHLHHEVFRQWELADALRERFWQRLETLAHNHVLTLLWTQMTAPFWHGYGFQPPTADFAAKFPAAFGDQGGPWMVLSLRPEPVIKVDVEKEFKMFQMAERQRTEQAMEHARWLKRLATILAVLLFIGVLAGMSYLLFKSQSPR